MPRPYNIPLPEVYPPCRHCGSVRRFIRDKGPHIGICCENAHFRADWLDVDDFREGSLFFGLISLEDFDPKVRQRAKKFQIIEHIRAAVVQEEACILCRTVRFPNPSSPTAHGVLVWLTEQRPSLLNRIRDHFAKGRRDGLALVPKDWSAKIPDELKEEIRQELRYSQIECDHLVPVKYLKLMEGNLPKAVLEYGGRRLAVPLCQRCNRGRHLMNLEAPQTLLERWVTYKFDGSREAALRSAEWSMVERLVLTAGSIDRNLRALRA